MSSSNRASTPTSEKYPYSRDAKSIHDDDADSLDVPSLQFGSHSPSLIYELSSTRALNATYSLPNGEAVYKSDTPRELFFPDETTLERVTDIQPTAEATNFPIVGKIHHKTVHPTVLEFTGESRQSNELFRKESWGRKSWSSFGRDRIFKLPDGREVKWCLGIRVCKLVTNDTAKTLLVIFHRHRIGLLPNKPRRHASLEIFPTAIDEFSSNSTDFSDGVLNESQRRIVEMILVTFLYVEKVRNDRQEAAQRGGGSGGGG